MKAFVEYIVKALVDYPDQVVVNEVDGSQTVVIEIRLNSADNGKIIGKHGRNIMSIRSLLESVAAKHGKRAILELIEPADRAHPKREVEPTSIPAVDSMF